LKGTGRASTLIFQFENAGILEEITAGKRYKSPNTGKTNK